MSLTILLDREKPRKATVKLSRGSRVQALDKQVVTLEVLVWNENLATEIWVELNKSEAETLANALKAAVR